MKQTTQVSKAKIADSVRKLRSFNLPQIHHTIIEIVTDAKSEIDGERLISNMLEFCNNMNLSVVQITHHQFQPQGISAVAVLEESHLAIHSWPELGYIHFDLVTCTQLPTNLDHCLFEITKIFKTDNIRVLGLEY
jgi:S-adenosylmethionine decarboxylase